MEVPKQFKLNYYFIDIDLFLKLFINYYINSECPKR